MGKVRQAVIMVGGKGTRLRPLTDNCPKPVLPVLDKPCLEYFIDSIVKAGIEEVILACGYKSEHVPAALGDGSDKGIKIRYSYEDRPMGTGGAIKLLEGQLDDVFLAVNGDVFIDIDVQKEIDDHFSHDASITVSMTTVDNPTEYGIMGLDETGRITRFKDKPKPEEVFSNYINTGVYVVRKDVLKYIPKDTMYDMSKELFPLLVEKGYRLQGHPIQGHWRDVGRPSDYFEANLETAYRSKDSDMTGVRDSTLSGTTYVGRDTVIDNCEINDSVFHKGCSVSRSMIDTSLILSGTKIDSADIYNSILGKGCIIGNNVRLYNTVLGDGVIIPDDTEIEGLIDNLKFKRKCVFLDRDDTINDDIGHCARPEDIKLFPGVSKALKRLNENGYLTIMITNQSVIGRGIIDEKGLEAIHDKMKDDLLKTGGGVIDDIFFCPHHPDDGCECRKPKPLMGIRAIEKYNIDVKHSYMIGDADKDMEFGNNIGVTSVKVTDGYDFVKAVDDILNGKV